MKWFKRALVLFVALLAGPVLNAASGTVKLGQDWRTADRSSAGIAPDPRTTPEAVVQVYAARAFSWRGLFAVHTWIATKPRGAASYTVHQVIGWRQWHGLPVVVSREDAPDRNWFGNTPRVIAELRGPRAAAAIPAILDAVARYPFPDRYTVWPGPNSNTFTAWIGHEVPALELALPVTAIGKDYITDGGVFDHVPSNTGYQFSILGVLGILAARREGLEVNLLGLVFGVDPLGPALKLPGIGRVGWSSQPG